MLGQGWCTPEKGIDLAMAILKMRASVVFEVGTFLGSSLIPQAMACAEQDHGLVYAVDPWSREAGIEGYDGENLKWWGNLNYEEIYEKFLANVKAAGVEKYVRVLRQKSDDVEVPDALDVLSIDGQHTDQASRDVERFASKVVPSGYVFMDDIVGWNGAPARAAEKLVAMGFTKLFNRDTGAMYQRDEAKRLPTREAKALAKRLLASKGGIEKLMDELSKAAPKKKGGWPKGKKRKPVAK